MQAVVEIHRAPSGRVASSSPGEEAPNPMLSSMKFGTKLRFLGLSVLMCATVALAYASWQNEHTLYQQKTERTRNIVESVAALVEHHPARAMWNHRPQQLGFLTPPLLDGQGLLDFDLAQGGRPRPAPGRTCRSISPPGARAPPPR